LGFQKKIQLLHLSTRASKTTAAGAFLQPQVRSCARRAFDLKWKRFLLRGKMAEFKSSLAIAAIVAAWIALIAGIYAWVSAEQAAMTSRAGHEQAAAPANAGQPAVKQENKKEKVLRK
jgi:hypothetical protein